jgi:hypothetical protein
MSSHLQYVFYKKLPSSCLPEDTIKGTESVERCVDIPLQRGSNSVRLRPDGSPREIFASRAPVRELPESFHFQPAEESALNHNKEAETDDNRAFRNRVLLVCSAQGIEMLPEMIKFYQKSSGVSYSVTD